jgi:endo-1,4-beta-D-glucanase Y
MNRRTFLSVLASVAPLSAAGSAAAQLLTPLGLATRAAPLWEAWKATYMASNGRVIDRLQQEASHSEGQGYGMLLATEFGDEPAFRLMFDWAELNLAMRGDGLMAWRWLPNVADPVPDRNNASDGDLFIAWALVRAAERFNSRQFLDRAIITTLSLSEQCIVANPNDPNRLLFLPAVHGFSRDGVVSINPSYYMPLAMREVASATGVSSLAICADHGEALLVDVAASGLVPDWIDISASGWVPSVRMSANTGYEALRVPLFLIWSGAQRHPAVQQAATIYNRTVQPGVPVPTVLEPVSGVVLESSSDAGYRALAGLVTCSGRGSIGAEIPPFNTRQPYYPATLQLFTMIAANRTSPECVPI